MQFILCCMLLNFKDMKLNDNIDEICNAIIMLFPLWLLIAVIIGFISKHGI